MELKSVTFELSAAEPEKAAAWYAELLETEVVRPGAGLFEVKMAGAYLVLSDAKGASDIQGSVNLEVDDAERARNDLVDRGYACSELQSFEGMMAMFSLADPDGRNLTFMQVGG